LSCWDCKGKDKLQQVPYAYICECGRRDTVYIPKHDKTHTIILINKNSFISSHWYCRTCKTPLYINERDGLGFRPCSCAPRKGKRGVLLGDGRFFYSQTFDLVEIEPKILERWKENGKFSELLLGAVLYIPAYKTNHVLDLSKWKPRTDDVPFEFTMFKETLVKRGMSEQEADEMIKESMEKSSSNPWMQYEQELSKFKENVRKYPWKDSRQTIEYVFVRDEASIGSISLDKLIESAERNGDTNSFERLKNEKVLGESLGLVNLRIVESLPVLLGGYGFTRNFQSPMGEAESEAGIRQPQVVLQPYPEQSGKIPIYIARNTTEAILYELDPWRTAAFLSKNLGIEILQEDAFDEASIRAWLLEKCNYLLSNNESHFNLKEFEIKNGLTVDLPSALAFGLVHTMSHVLKAVSYRFIGVDADSIAEYLFPAHSAGILYVSSHVQFTLGGMDSVFRTNLSALLGLMRDYAGTCSFDPVCSNSGGACLACLYTKFGCSCFNRTLSRVFLLGGEISGYEKPIVGFLDIEVSKIRDHLKKIMETKSK
jgi:hypothetical protein